MKIGDLPFKWTGLYFNFIEDWSQFFYSCNWYTFRFFKCEFEWERNMGGVEFTFIAFGLGFDVRYNYTETEDVKNIKEEYNKIDWSEF